MADSQNIKRVKVVTLTLVLECDPSVVTYMESPLNAEQVLSYVFETLGWELNAVHLQGPVTKEIKIDP